MEGLWYDSRGIEWDPTSKSPRAVAVATDEHCAAQVVSRHQLTKPHDSAASKASAPPDWVMGMLDGDTTDEPTQQRKASDPAGSSPPFGAAKQNSEQAISRAMQNSTAAGTPPAHHDTVSGSDPEEDSDEHDDFVDLLEKDLSRRSTHHAPKTTGAWKMATANRSTASDNDIDDEDGDYAEQLASELQCGEAAAIPAAKARPTPGRPGSNTSSSGTQHRRPTAAERREQDAKWMACS